MLRYRVDRLTLAFIALWSFLATRPLNAQDSQVDLVIYGGTSSGIVAAIAASKLGHSVALIEPTEHLGGLTTGGLGATDIDIRLRRLLSTEQRLKESGRAFSFMWLDDAQRPERVAVRLRTTTETSPTGG